MAVTNGDRLPRERLLRRALWLVWIGEVWNMLETGVGLWSGLTAGSVALVAYGFDGLIELFAGAVMIWRLNQAEKEETAAEKKALKLIGITFFLLSAYILVQAVATLIGWFAAPQESMVGIVLVIASAVLMTLLFFWKTNLAKRKKANSKYNLFIIMIVS